MTATDEQHATFSTHFKAVVGLFNVSLLIVLCQHQGDPAPTFGNFANLHRVLYSQATSNASQGQQFKGRFTHIGRETAQLSSE